MELSRRGGYLPEQQVVKGVLIPFLSALTYMHNQVGGWGGGAPVVWRTCEGRREGFRQRLDLQQRPRRPAGRPGICSNSIPHATQLPARGQSVCSSDRGIRRHAPSLFTARCCATRPFLVNDCFLRAARRRGCCTATSSQRTSCWGQMGTSRWGRGGGERGAGEGPLRGVRGVDGLDGDIKVGAWAGRGAGGCTWLRGGAGQPARRCLARCASEP